MKLDNTYMLDPKFLSELKKKEYKRTNKVMNKISYWAYRIGLTRSYKY